jgi:hypothetical protein
MYVDLKRIGVRGFTLRSPNVEIFSSFFHLISLNSLLQEENILVEFYLHEIKIAVEIYDYILKRKGGLVRPSHTQRVRISC